jgi:hypothetical protein
MRTVREAHTPVIVQCMHVTCIPLLLSEWDKAGAQQHMCECMGFQQGDTFQECYGDMCPGHCPQMCRSKREQEQLPALGAAEAKALVDAATIAEAQLGTACAVPQIIAAPQS